MQLSLGPVRLASKQVRSEPAGFSLGKLSPGGRKTPRGGWVQSRRV